MHTSGLKLRFHMYGSRCSIEFIFIYSFFKKEEEKGEYKKKKLGTQY